MSKIIKKNGEITVSHWRHLEEETPWPEDCSPFTISFSRLKSLGIDLPHPNSEWGVRIRPEDDLNEIRDILGELDLVVLEMGPFTDGRSFTQARDLRERFNYLNEIRVIGDFLQDQMYFLDRLGVDSFEFNSEAKLPDQEKVFGEFSFAYQVAPNGPEPVCRKRALGI